ncbi:hypothetical protein GCM10009096_23570 [Parasphingorhabdus litoris]|uniref:Flagellar hook-associated protein 1 n=1 Tax=Parasphingorhabdus litoris TaxID=394733 RepID=A0ABN1APC7_9SPHN|nr:hypothetical protein [Parasphingorhabdus litoris]
MSMSGIGSAADSSSIQNASIRAIEARTGNLHNSEAQLHLAQSTGPNQTVAQRISDPVVDDRVSQTVEFAGYHLSDPSYIIGETLNDPSLSQAQKDEYIARLVEISRLTNHRTLEGDVVTTEVTSKLRKAFEDIGDTWTDPQTPELRDQVRDAITRGADSGRLSATDLHGLFDTENGGSTDGIRSLLSNISNGDTLHSLSTRLLQDAQRIGFDVSYGPAPGLLVAAADFANMAARQGNTAAANAVVAEIHAQTQGLSPSDAASFIREMNYIADQDRFGGPQDGRAGFDVLTDLLGSATTRTEAGRAAADSLFANLVRSNPQNWPDDGTAMSRLGEYFNAHLPRMIENDWRVDGPNSGEQTTRVIQDFMQHVMLDPNYSGRDATATAISNEMQRLAGVVGNEAIPEDLRDTAATSFGALMGSLQKAGQLYIAEARASTEANIENVRLFSDLLTSKLLERGGPVGGAIGGRVVDAAWEVLANRAESRAAGDVEDRIGGLKDLGQIFRNAMQDLDAEIIRLFDGTLDEYLRTRLD